MDTETGLYYLRARYMNPETATFTSMDSYAGNIYDPASLHRYLYANANPVKYTDPSGHSPLVSLTTSVRCLVMKDVTKILCTMAVMSGLINMGLKALRQGYNNLFCDANEDFDVRDYIESFVEGLVGGALLGTLAITIAFMANMQLLTMYAMLLGVSVVMGVIQIAIATYNSDELGVAISAVFLLLSVFAVSKLWGLKQKIVVNKTDGKAKVIEVEDGTVKTKTEPCIDEGTPVAGEEGNSGNGGKTNYGKSSKNVAKGGSGKQTGSYVIKFKSGKVYVGKGPKSRMEQSAKYRADENNDIVVSKEWEPANSDEDAFIDEYLKLKKYGGPKSSNTYNKIQSPGKKYYEKRINSQGGND